MKDRDIVFLGLNLNLCYMHKDIKAEFLNKYKPIFDELNAKSSDIKPDNFASIADILEQLSNDDFKDQKPEQISVDDIVELSEVFSSDNEINQLINQLKININAWNEFVSYACCLPILEAVSNILQFCLTNNDANLLPKIANFIFINCEFNDNQDFINYLEESCFEKVMEACDAHYKEPELFKPFSKIIKSYFCSFEITDCEKYYKVYKDKIQKWVKYYTEGETKNEETVFYMLFPIIVQPKRPYTEEDAARDAQK